MEEEDDTKNIIVDLMIMMKVNESWHLYKYHWDQHKNGSFGFGHSKRGYDEGKRNKTNRKEPNEMKQNGKKEEMKPARAKQKTKPKRTTELET
eukprot:13496475-Ditylum_brightwellii.AAC.1